jgi:predicted ester cyclase
MDAILESNKAMVRRFNYEFIQGKDVRVFEETVHPQFINRSTPPNVHASKNGVLQFMQIMWQVFPDLEVKINMQIAEGDLVTTHKTFQATHKGTFMGIEATNKRVRYDSIDIIRVKDGQAIEHWSIRDNNALLQQLTAK